MHRQILYHPHADPEVLTAVHPVWETLDPLCMDSLSMTCHTVVGQAYLTPLPYTVDHPVIPVASHPIVAQFRLDHLFHMIWVLMNPAAQLVLEGCRLILVNMVHHHLTFLAPQVDQTDLVPMVLALVLARHTDPWDHMVLCTDPHHHLWSEDLCR